MKHPANARKRLKKLIEEHAFVRSEDALIVSRRGTATSRWLFDIRSILMRSDAMEDMSELFWNEFAERRVQIGCIESAGIALASALIANAKKHTSSPCTGFFVRKSRKKDGLLKRVEGTLGAEDIVLVDDILNSGRSLMKQVEVLRAEGKRVSAVWTLIRFREPSFYESFKAEGIDIHCVFELDDFADTLGVHNLPKRDVPPPRQAFDVVWKFGSPSPSYFHVVPKSEPALDDARLFVGSDSGTFRCFDQRDGSVAWEYRVGFHPKKKGIFSSPALFEDTVYFGAYDGNVYALDKATGKKRWVNFDADWVGSSPAVAPDLGLLFIGLEFGLWRRRGGIIALDAKTGERKWAHEMPCFTHSSPLYLAKHREVVIGSNDGAVYLFDATSGTLKWKFEAAPLTENELNYGFSANDIKASFAYDEKRDALIFGTMNGDVIALDRATGGKRVSFKADFGVYSTPVVSGDTVLVSSLDHHLYCLDLDTLEEKWRWYGGARIFSTPALIKGSIYVGTNAGELAELDPATGAKRSAFVVPERITNRVAYDEKTDRFFLTTFANEVYCLKKRVA